MGFSDSSVPYCADQFREASIWKSPNCPNHFRVDKDFQNVGDKIRILGGSWDFLVLQDEWISPPHGFPKC